MSITPSISPITGQVKEITELIARVQKRTQEAVAAMEQGSKEVDLGTHLAEEAGLALKNIIAAVGAANAGMMRIASAAKEMEGASQQVVSLVDSVSSVAERSTAATEQMSASSRHVAGSIERVSAVTEETSAAAEEVSASTEEMTAQVEEMTAQVEEMVSQFKLGEEAQQGSAVVMRRRKNDWNETRSPRLAERGRIPVAIR